jgi:putative thioredoxin
VVPDSQLKEFVKRLIGDAKPPIEEALEEAATTLEAGNAEAASDIYAQILDADTENAGAIAGLIRCSIATGDHEAAQAIIDGLTPEMRKDASVSASIAALELAETSSTPDEVEPLLAKLEQNAKDHQARYDLAMAYYGSGQNQAAIESLINIIRQDQAWNDDAARLQLLKIFEALGHSAPLTMDGRRQLSSVLFS